LLLFQVVVVVVVSCPVGQLVAFIKVPHHDWADLEHFATMAEGQRLNLAAVFVGSSN